MLNTMTKQTKKKSKEKTPWDKAKPLLLKLHLDGTITNAMKPRDVWAMQQEFVDVKCENFCTNFATMKRTIRKQRHHADVDEAGCLDDIAIHSLASSSDGCWDGSEAQRLLKLDMEKNRHKNVKPELLWITRPEHQKFKLEKFRGHIHQELRSDRETLHWIVKKKKKEQMKESTRFGKKVNKEDMDFLCDPVPDMWRRVAISMLMAKVSL